MQFYFFRITLIFCLVFLRAQSQTTGSISGFILDQNEAALPSAQVVLRAEGDARERSARADANGVFRFDKLATGEYELKVEREGFKTTIVRVSVGPRSSSPLRIVLPVADVQQDVTINDDAVQVDTESGNNQNVVALDRELLSNLPTFDRDVIGMASRFLDAGAIGTGGATLIVDGMEARKLGVTQSAIQEIKINNNPYSAEYSRPGRGRIEVTTKPGAPQFHGELNWTFRDARMNARDPFAATRAPEQKRVYEGMLTGPVNKNKKHPISFLLTAERDFVPAHRARR